MIINYLLGHNIRAYVNNIQYNLLVDPHSTDHKKLFDTTRDKGFP